MKTRILMVAALIVAIALPVMAVQVSPSAGYAVSTITLDGMIRGFDVLSNGNMVVLAGTTDAKTGLENTSLYEIDSNGNKVGNDLYSFQNPTFGSFVRVDQSSDTVYFGESWTGKIKSINLDGTGLADVATVSNNYDFAVNNSGEKFVSAGNATWTASDVFRLDNASMSKIVDTVCPYSGPIAFDAAGNLYAGTAGVATGDSVLKWTASQIAGVASNGALTDNDGLAIGGGYMTVSGLDTMGSNVYYSNPFALMCYTGSDPTQMVSTDSWICSVRANQADGSVLFATGNQICAVKAVPEPASLMILAVGFGGLILRRRK